MAKTYTTKQVASGAGIHTNTVRLYEDLGLITKPQRKANGYRVFTDMHRMQVKLVRTAFAVEVLQNGLRRQAIAIVKAAAMEDWEGALKLSEQYSVRLACEQHQAEEALAIARHWQEHTQGMESAVTTHTRKQTAELLNVSMDALRNWEMNGLLSVKRRHNGYRVYTDEDIRRLKMIRALRCGGYSLAAILRMLTTVSENPNADIRSAIDTPQHDEDIISVCDKLLTSLRLAKQNAQLMRQQLLALKALSN